MFSEFAFFYLVSLASASVGFIHFLYFISIGYGLAVTALGAAAVYQYRESFTILNFVQAALLAAYGVRLAIFIIQRLNTEQYKKEMAESWKKLAEIKLPVKVAVWLGVSLQYVLMCSPVIYNKLYTQENQGANSSLLWQLFGIATMVIGLVVESIADNQKSEAKKVNAARFCDVGLYQLVRCPNYLGEIVFWIGNWIAGIGAYGNSWAQWLVATIGLILIVNVMVGSTKRLEKKQLDRYGKMPEYQAYAAKVPVLIPYVPIYTLQGLKYNMG